MTATAARERTARPAAEDGTAPGAVLFHRPARAFPAPAEGAPVAVAAPPIVEPPTARGFLQVLLPVVGSLSILGFALVYRNPLFLAIAGGIVVLSVVAAVAVHLGQRRASLRKRRRDAGRYQAHLDKQRTRLAEIAAVQRAGATRLHPDPAALGPVLAGRRDLWERQRGDPDFLHARIGLGTVPLAVPVRLELGTNPLVEYVPALEAAATEVVAD